jgi:hypothetical protein
MEINCKCGRVWRLMDYKEIFRDPGKITCNCGQVLQEWHGSRTWSAELIRGLPEDEGKPKPCTFE